MDPIYYQVNQSRLTENTQKSSDNLRIQQNKEAKRKSEKAGEVDKSATASDLSSMSDDMLGDMDPDDYGGQGAKQFAQMWKEQFTDPPDEDDSQEEESGDGDEQADEGGSDHSEEESPQDEQVPLKEEVPVVAESRRSPETVAPQDQSQVQSQSQVKVQGQNQGHGQEQVQGSLPKESEAPAPLPRTPAPGPTSLLDFSNGFLIAEEAQWDVNASDIQAVEEVVVEEEVLDEDISIILERMVGGDSSQPTYRKLCHLLSRFGRSVLQVCSESQVKVYLLPPGEPLTAHPQLHNSGYDDLAGAAYLPQNRLCLVEDECLANAPQGFHPLFFYFAHAFDHALGGENFASLKSPAVRASYLACLDGAHRFGDLMAAHSPAHYFAQAVESYLAENDCFEPFWTRQDLYDFDRSMYDYVEYLLRVKR